MFLTVSQDYELFGTHRNEGGTQGKIYLKLSSLENHVKNYWSTASTEQSQTAYLLIMLSMTSPK